MLFHAYRQKADLFWYLIIIFIPWGALIYFLFAVLPQFLGMQSTVPAASGSGDSGLSQPDTEPLGKLRQEVKETPSLQNQIKLGKALLGANRLEESIGVFETCISLDRTDSEAIYWFGRALVQKGDFERARRCFSQLIEIDPSFREYDPWLDLAAVYHKLENGDLMLRTLEKLVEESPRVKHKTLLGRGLIDEGRYQEASKILQEAMDDYEEASFFLKQSMELWHQECEKLLAELPRAISLN